MDVRAGTAASLCTLLETMEALGDEDLRAVVARAQGLLLDGAESYVHASGLSVEIVDGAERALLCRYRALPPPEQRRLLGRARGESRVPHRLVTHAAALS